MPRCSRCLRRCRRASLLADEVGLGKTIEAGLVIAQRWAERRRRILLIVPASLRKQWSQELFEKFSLPSFILESQTYNEARKKGIEAPFDPGRTGSHHLLRVCCAKPDDVLRGRWDLVVFDEAHRLRNVYKQGRLATRQGPARRHPLVPQNAADGDATAKLADGTLWAGLGHR